MASKAIKIIKKRSIKPKTQYSPSNPTATTMYHLILYNDTKTMMIIGTSSIKRYVNDSTVMLNDGRTAKLIVSGTKDECMKYWNKQTRTSNDNNDGEQDEHEDEIPDLMEQTLQMPTNMFSTPAPYRRQTTVINRASSPDSILFVPSSKRLTHENRPNHSTKRRIDDPSFLRNSNRVTTEVSSVISSSDDEEEMMDVDDKISLRRILEELKNTQTNLVDARSENRDIHEQLIKLTQKVDQFNSIVSSKNNQDIDRYRDSNSKEVFDDEIKHEGRNLLEVPARNAAEYARSLLKILFKPHELQSSLLPSQHSKRYLKSELDQERFNLLNEAVRTRYRIAKHHYTSFYKDTIQESLANFLYNEGPRKQKKQSMEQQIVQQQSQRNTTTAFDQSG